MAEIVTVEGIVDASPDAVFDVLADPAKHPLIDGSGTVKEVRASGPARLSQGAKFGMSMKAGVPYRVTNTVTEFEEDRRIAWHHFMGHTWRWTLEPVDGGTRTKVVEQWDPNTSKAPWLLEAVGFGKRNRKGMEASVERLRALFEIMLLSIVDAFTDVAFGGNPAAVCILDRFPSDELMQAIAAEMNLSETAFCASGADDAAPRSLRWFTPVAEVDLCGHATLATTHVLGGSSRYSTRSGVLTGITRDDGSIELDFPADPSVEHDPPAGLVQALDGVSPTAVLAGRDDWLVELADAAAVRALQPDLSALVALGRRGLIATAAGDGVPYDVVSRCFYPAYGIPEDPVTGSAHCTLASYWTPRLGRDELLCEQASRRGGVVRTRLEGDRVVLGGRAVTVATTVIHDDALSTTIRR